MSLPDRGILGGFDKLRTDSSTCCSLLLGGIVTLTFCILHLVDDIKCVYGKSK